MSERTLLFTVTLLDTELPVYLCPGLKSDEGHEIHGAFLSNGETRIELDAWDDEPTMNQQATLLHEMYHACFYYLGTFEDKEERVVRTMDFLVPHLIAHNAIVKSFLENAYE